MPCGLCGNHSNIEVCKRCKNCDYAHQMKFGIDFKNSKPVSNEPCPQICRFQLPNKQWITYKCRLKLHHDGQCDFGVNVESLNRLARDSIDGR